jgi:hypothetical protein
MREEQDLRTLRKTPEHRPAPILDKIQNMDKPGLGRGRVALPCRIVYRTMTGRPSPQNELFDEYWEWRVQDR